MLPKIDESNLSWATSTAFLQCDIAALLAAAATCSGTLDIAGRLRVTGFCTSISPVGLVILSCLCRLTVELTANRPAGHPRAGIPAIERVPLKERAPLNERVPLNERNPAAKSKPRLQCLQAGLQVTHVQAQPQVQSQLCVLLSPETALVLHLQAGT